MGYCSRQAFSSSNPAAGRCNRGRNQYSADWRFSTLLRDHRHSYLFQHGCDLFERGIHVQIQSHVAIVIIEHEYSSGDGVIVPKWDVTRFNQTTSRLRIFQDHIIQRQIDSLSVAAVHFLFSRSLNKHIQLSRHGHRRWSHYQASQVQFPCLRLSKTHLGISWQHKTKLCLSTV